MKLGSLCTGILGLDCAVAEHFGADLVWYSEIDAAPISVIEREHPSRPNLGDLKQIEWADVPPVDVLTAGYPCQPFSAAGKRKGKDDPRHLWPYIAEAVRVLRPRRVVLENVAGHLTLGFGDVLRDLAEAGFDAEWCLLRASDVGAPHGRARLFIVATDATQQPCVDVRGDSRNPGSPSGGSWARQIQQLGRQRRPSAPDTDRGRLQERSEPHGRTHQPGLKAPRRRDANGRRTAVGWSQYGPAIERWGRVLGRPAPRPTDDDGRLSPPFVEWMMGYPAGWVDGLTHTQALKALGNAVVPQQGLAALRELSPVLEQAA